MADWIHRTNNPVIDTMINDVDRNVRIENMLSESEGINPDEPVMVVEVEINNRLCDSDRHQVESYTLNIYDDGTLEVFCDEGHLQKGLDGVTA